MTGARRAMSRPRLFLFAFSLMLFAVGPFIAPARAARQPAAQAHNSAQPMAQRNQTPPPNQAPQTNQPAQPDQTPPPNRTPPANQPPAPAAQSAPTPPPTNPADVASVDAIIAALYDVISGPAGQRRDWNRMRSLFIPGARLIPTAQRREGGFAARVLDVEGYISSSGNYIETNGFFEREIARRTEQFGQIAHVFSTYEARHKADDPRPFMRGINSIQLLNDGQRWWVVTVFWQAESESNPLPAQYLPGESR